MKDDVPVSSSVLIVIGQVLTDPWLEITRRGQFPTWLRDAEDQGIAVRHSHGRQSNALIRSLDRAHEWLRWHGRGRTLIPRVDSWLGRPWTERVPKIHVGEFLSPGAVAWQQSLVDVYALQRWKVIGSFTQALAEDFTHAYFTTASSYVRINELIQVVGALPSTGLYAGTPYTDALSGTHFASGANRVFSRDVIEAVVTERKRYRNDVMEDVGLGRLISEMGYALTPLPSLNVSSMQAVESLSDEDILANFHFRATSGTRSQRQDVSVMNILHARVIELERKNGIRSA